MTRNGRPRFKGSDSKIEKKGHVIPGLRMGGSKGVLKGEIRKRQSEKTDTRNRKSGGFSMSRSGVGVGRVSKKVQEGTEWSLFIEGNDRRTGGVEEEENWEGGIDK